MSHRKQKPRRAASVIPNAKVGNLANIAVDATNQVSKSSLSNLQTPLLDTQAQLKAYELYITRLIKEGEWYWARFNIFLGVNTAAFAAVGFFLRDDFRKFEETPLGVSCAVAIVAFAGFVL